MRSKSTKCIRDSIANIKRLKNDGKKPRKIKTSRCAVIVCLTFKMTHTHRRTIMNKPETNQATSNPDREAGGCCGPSPCSADLIRAAWEEYHGPIIDEGGEEYIPAMPPAFLRGFVDGYEQGKKSREIVDILILAEPIMEAWAKSHELEEWHCRVEDLLGTAYPSFMDLPNAGHLARKPASQDSDT
jgi:hypothetical protein